MIQTIFLNNNSPDALKSILDELNPGKIFLVRGKKSYELAGARCYVEAAVAGLKCDIYEFCDFEENPKIEDVEKGLHLLSEKGADIVIGIGGGSVLDMAKLIRFLYSYTGEITKNDFSKCNKLLPLIVLPTTAGTGTEATHFAVVYKNKVKYSVAHEDILPDYSIINPLFTYNNPRYLAACTGFDALAQAIEAYWSVQATKESDDYAIKAIKLLWDNLPSAVNLKKKECMDKVSEGAYWAGKAINIAKTTAPHAISYAFTTYYNIPHGNAVALTFPFFVEFNMNIDEKHKEKINTLFYFLGIDESKAIVPTMQSYIKSIGLLTSLHFDMDIILNNINIERMNNNPKVLSREDIYTVLNSIIDQR
ncbi:alcohol dehydrogenase [Spirochaetia bacterium]|nr:alcohol dehydrogenase [Spirochaetia bacterium]